MRRRAGTARRSRLADAAAGRGAVAGLNGAALIAVDWGTTSVRAYRLAPDGSVAGERSAPLGIQQVREGAFAAALQRLLGDWADDPAPRIACGMIGSRQGWIEAPYCDCPVAFETLAAGLVRAPGDVLTIVPGVTCVDAAGVPDVIRGEETQIFGATAAARAAAGASSCCPERTANGRSSPTAGSRRSRPSSPASCMRCSRRTASSAGRCRPAPRTKSARGPPSTAASRAASRQAPACCTIFSGRAPLRCSGASRRRRARTICRD